MGRAAPARGLSTAFLLAGRRFDLNSPHGGRVRCAATRSGRDSAALEAALAALRSGAANDGVNLMPPIIECARAGATEGEMVIALQEVFGTYTETPVY